MLNAVDDGHGGLEHRASTALIAAAARPAARRRGRAERRLREAARPDQPRVLPHLERQAPAAGRVRALDYTQENYTGLLWFFEGFTCYYDDLFLLRAGLIDAARYLQLVAKTASGVLATPGRKVQSLAQASFDAWVKYYRSDENTPNATISYYTKGALVALALDLSLRGGRGGKASLDEVMRQLWRAAAAARSARPTSSPPSRPWPARGAAPRWPASCSPGCTAPTTCRCRRCSQRAGVAVAATQPATLAQRWGLRVSESALTGVKVTAVLRGGAAERAGLAAGDELLAVDGWRLRRLDDARGRAARGVGGATARVARPARADARARRAARAAAATAAQGAVQLAVDDDAGAAARALRKAWLGC